MSGLAKESTLAAKTRNLWRDAGDLVLNSFLKTWRMVPVPIYWILLKVLHDEFLHISCNIVVVVFVRMVVCKLNQYDGISAAAMHPTYLHCCYNVVSVCAPKIVMIILQSQSIGHSRIHLRVWFAKTESNSHYSRESRNG